MRNWFQNLLFKWVNLCRCCSGAQTLRLSVTVRFNTAETCRLVHRVTGHVHGGAVYKLNAVDPWIESAWFQPSSLLYEVEKRFRSLLFQMRNLYRYTTSPRTSGGTSGRSRATCPGCSRPRSPSKLLGRSPASRDFWLGAKNCITFFWMDGEPPEVWGGMEFDTFLLTVGWSGDHLKTL